MLYQVSTKIADDSELAKTSAVLEILQRKFNNVLKSIICWNEGKKVEITFEVEVSKNGDLYNLDLTMDHDASLRKDFCTK